MTHVSTRSLTIIISFVLIILSGCGGRSAPSRYYILSALKEGGPPGVGHESDLSVGIGPVKIPGYLNRPQIVTRGGQNELLVADFERWGGSLPENIASVIAENLSPLLPETRVYPYPWIPNLAMDYSVTVDITRLDGSLGGDVILEARWVVTGREWKKILKKGVARYSARAKGYEYGEYVSAESSLLVRLSKEIAGSIREASAIHLPVNKGK